MWTFVWLDYSELERRKMLDVVDASATVRFPARICLRQIIS